MNIDLSKIPEHALEAVRIVAATQGETLQSPEDYLRYLHEDEDALEIVLPYIDTDL